MTLMIMDFPDEILVNVILKLPWKTILIVQRVNQRICALVCETKVIQYTIELGCAGMVDCQAIDTVEKRLDKLRRYQASWMRLKSNRRQLIQLPQSPIWELSGGVLAQGIPSTPGSFDVHRIVFTRLARDARGQLNEKQWEYENSDMEIRDFTMDPSQDLAVFISTPRPADTDETAKIVFMFVTLRTFRKHPRAHSGILMHEISTSLASRCTNIQQLCANYICFLHSAQFDDASEELIVWDWVSGEMKFRLTDCMVRSFSFITPTHLLLALQLGLESDTLDTYETPVRLVICDIEATAHIEKRGGSQGGQNSYSATCVLDLPPMQPYADIVDVLIRSDPAPFSHKTFTSPETDDSETSQDQDTRKSSGDVPFALAPHNRLFVINISVYPEDDMDEDDVRSDYINLALFIPLSTLMKFTSPSSHTEVIFGAAARSATPSTATNVQVKWDEWVPRGSRIFVLPNEERVWVCNVYGSRFVYALESSQADGEPAPRRFAVMDFNPHAARRAIAVVDSKSTHVEHFQLEEHKKADIIEASHVEWSCVPSTLSSEKYRIFTQDVTTDLPFQQSFSRNAFVFDGLLLTEDNILLVKASHIHLHGVTNFVL
ncbi:hypothetical protein SCHPADRAFT_539426 [Schizopora paradoxa]|uniref:F-box domain-containing protein n=1 Tax=Schizopora paradoxa TaxID=27342 RepID=A0A0H2RDY1_9AGAM|nr:hypothetical protein SCHPADRAFT_539426 [Schizopora paradoxa]